MKLRRLLVVVAAVVVVFLCSPDSVSAAVAEPEKLAMTWDTDIDDVDSPEYHPSFSRLRRRAARVKRAGYPDRPGEPTLTHSCSFVRALPPELRNSSVLPPWGAKPFYQKYTEAYGIPVISSNNVTDAALSRACYVLRFSLADVASVRRSFYKRAGRVGVVSEFEVTTDIPEHSALGSFWNTRARGMGGTVQYPISTGAVENILCWNSSKDRYSTEDITLHELSHAVHMLGANFAVPNFMGRLKQLYNNSRRAGRWAQTYAMTNFLEYFAEGVQSYFNSNTFSPLPNGVHNSISTRARMRLYDPDLHDLIAELYPCNNTYLSRCTSTREDEERQVLRMDCQPPTRSSRTTPPSSDCGDQNVNCRQWAREGACRESPAYMLRHCSLSCNFCNPLIECEDTDESCPGKALDGRCPTGTIRMSCPRSCKVCPTLADPYPCRDLNAYCKIWASIGECGTDYMTRYCRRSCRLCWHRPYSNLLQSLLETLQMASSIYQHQEPAPAQTPANA